VRVDRYGQETPISAEPRGIAFPASLRRQVGAITVDPRPSSIWVVNAATGQAVPLTTDKYHSIGPVWSSDGTRVAFNHYVNGENQIVWMSAQPGTELHQVFAPGAKARLGDIGVNQWTGSAGFFGYQTGTRSRYCGRTSCTSSSAIRSRRDHRLAGGRSESGLVA
jgi:hypothetical protein